MLVVKIDWRGAPAFLASLRDVTDRKRAEAVLARVGAQHAAIALLGEAAVSGLPPDALMAEAAEHVRRVLAADFAAVLTLSPGGSDLRLVASQWSSAPWTRSPARRGRHRACRRTLRVPGRWPPRLRGTGKRDRLDDAFARATVGADPLGRRIELR
jgi:hypothetical protein